MARTKTVFPYAELVRVWLRQSQREGKSTGRGQMWFEGDTIFSYGRHFPIAKLVDAPNGERVCLGTTRSSSMTTNRHVGYVRQMLRGFNGRVIQCDSPSSEHSQNISSFKGRADNFISSHAKARKPERYAGGIFQACSDCRDYCEVFCLPVPQWATMPDGIEPGAPLKAALAVFQEERHR